MTGDATDEIGVLEVVVSDPLRGNTIDMRSLAAARSALRTNTGEIRSVLLRGTETTFCTGGNVRDFAGSTDIRQLMTGLIDDLNAFVLELVDARLPVVAAVTGWAAGAGMSLACLADVVVGGPSTSFRTAYSSIGFAPDGGMSWALPRVVGARTASRMLLENAPVRGEEARSLGLITHFTEDDDILSDGRALAEMFADGPGSAFRAIKELLAAPTDLTLEQALARERLLGVAQADSATGREGVRAFTEKRTARFPTQSEAE